jgi:xanthine dehydrogenase accessory factor
VKHWQETADLLSEVVGQAQASRRAALATVTRIRGSAYRRPGAKFLVRADGTTSGGVSGGCLEADVRERALAVLRDGAPRLAHYETGADDRQPFGLGLGCNGAVDVFLQPATTPAFLQAAARIRELLAGDAPFAISTVLAGGAAGHVSIRAGGSVPAETGVHAPDGVEVFTEVLRPPPNLVVFGAGDDALPLVRFAAEAGFRVAVVDHRPAFLSPERLPDGIRRHGLRAEDGLGSLPLGRDALAVVKTHSLAHDREWLKLLLGTEVAYIGVLGPRARVEELLVALGAEGDGRVFGPVGLDLGADGPEQVALSVVAELLAVRSGRTPGHLRARRGAIHAP